MPTSAPPVRPEDNYSGGPPKTNSQATIALVVGLVGIFIFGIVPSWVDRFLPFQAGSALFAAPAGDLLAWEGGAIFLAWAAALIVAGTALFSRRDLGSSG